MMNAARRCKQVRVNIRKTTKYGYDNYSVSLFDHVSAWLDNTEGAAAITISPDQSPLAAKSVNRRLRYSDISDDEGSAIVCGTCM